MPDGMGMFMYTYDGSKPVITIGLNQDILCENYETNDYTVWIEEQTGVDLQFVYFADDETESAQQLNAMIAAGEKLPDILVGFWLGDALAGFTPFVIGLVFYFSGSWKKGREH